MINQFRSIVALFIIASSYPISYAASISNATTKIIHVTVFKRLTTPVTRSVALNPLPANAKITIYNVDQLSALNSALTHQFNIVNQRNGIEAARTFAKQWINRYRIEYQKSARGVEALQMYHVTQVPAVVISGKVKVQGTADLDAAYMVYLNQGGDHA